MVELENRQNYINRDIAYLKNVKIVEYDMKSAHLSIIKEHKLLPQNKIDQLDAMTKLDRNMEIGRLQIENANLKDKLGKYLLFYIKKFRDVNNIDTMNILSIKKDAVFVFNSTVTTTQFGEFIKFVPKNKYTSYIFINKKEFYYNSLTDDIAIKGLNDTLIEKSDGFVKDIKNILRKSEELTQEEFFEFLKQYRSNYLNRLLPVESYKSLDDGIYKLKGKSKFTFDAMEDSTEAKEKLDITDNYIKYIYQLIKVVL